MHQWHLTTKRKEDGVVSGCGNYSRQDNRVYPPSNTESLQNKETGTKLEESYWAELLLIKNRGSSGALVFLTKSCSDSRILRFHKTAMVFPSEGRKLGEAEKRGLVVITEGEANRVGRAGNRWIQWRRHDCWALNLLKLGNFREEESRFRTSSRPCKLSGLDFLPFLHI